MKKEGGKCKSLIDKISPKFVKKSRKKTDFLLFYVFVL